MRRTQQIILAGSMALAMGIGLAGVQIAVAGAPPSSSSAAFAVTDDTRATDLAYSRDEERMARDLYLLFGQTYGAAIFDRIAASEQQHFNAVGSLLTAYAIADPAAGQPAGTYTDPDVQRLYDQWKAEGLTSLEDAYAVGVALEQADIADLEKIIARQTDADVQRVLSHLLAASRHHLAAFTDLANGGTAGASCDGSQTGVGSGMRDGHGTGGGAGMGDGAGMGRMGRPDS
jgi:hypothetical protein